MINTHENNTNSLNPKLATGCYRDCPDHPWMWGASLSYCFWDTELPSCITSCQKRFTPEKLWITIDEKINQPKTSLSGNFQGEESIKWILNRQEPSTWAELGPNVLPGASQQEPTAKTWSLDQHLSRDKKLLFKSKAAHKWKKKKPKDINLHWLPAQCDLPVYFCWCYFWDGTKEMDDTEMAVAGRPPDCP